MIKAPSRLQIEALSGHPKQSKIFKRLGKIMVWDMLGQLGISGRKRERIMDVSQVTMTRWTNAYNKHGLAGLVDAKNHKEDAQ